MLIKIFPTTPKAPSNSSRIFTYYLKKFNSQWRNHSIFKKFCTASPNTIKPMFEYLGCRFAQHNWEFHSRHVCTCDCWFRKTPTYFLTKCNLWSLYKIVELVPQCETKLYFIKREVWIDAQLFNIYLHENLRPSKVIQLLYLIFIGEYVKNLVSGLYGNEKTTMTQKNKPGCQNLLQNTQWLLLIFCTGWVWMFPRCTRLACYCQCICITNVSMKKVGFTSHFPTIIFEGTLVICQHGKQQQNYVRQRPNGPQNYPQNPKLWKPTALNNAGQLPAMGMRCCFHVWFFVLWFPQNFAHRGKISSQICW